MVDFKDLVGIELDLADAERRLALQQEAINELNALADFHNAHINTIHRDLHEAAALIGDIHRDGITKHKKRVAAHVKKHGHPQDVPETEPQD